MAKQHTPTNINSYRRKWNFNIGIILFGVIFIYLIATIIIYMTNYKISVYEVRQGSIIRDTAFTGFVVRDEITVSAESKGYLNYYVSDSEKVSFGANVYALSSEELIFAEDESEDMTSIPVSEQQNIRRKTQAFIEQFHASRFDNVHSFKSELNTELDNVKRDSRIAHLNTLFEDTENENISIYTAPQDGIVVYSTDGYESVQLEDITLEHMERKEYDPIQIYNNAPIDAGDVAYRLILDEDWQIVIALDENEAEELDELTRVNVRFAKDNQSMWADFSIIDKGEEGIFGCLQFNKSMIRYATDRYLHIELILENQSGLKIPRSSVTTKDFFVIPESFLTIGGNSQEIGVMYKDEDGKYVFKNVIVYYRDEKEELVYLNATDFQVGDVILQPDSTDETMYLQEMRALQGVYNINKGYAVFKQIHILSESEDYYIISEGNRYSLSNYDHISLTSDSITENDIVF